MRKSLLYLLLAVGLMPTASYAQVVKSSGGFIELPSTHPQTEVNECGGNDFYCQTFGPGLPFVWSKDRRDNGPEVTAFTAFVGDQAPADGDKAPPPQDPLIGDQPPEVRHVEHLAKPAAFPATTPSVIADQAVGIGFLIAGVTGWILLGTAFLVLVGRYPRP
jgi:hypothetical protein